VGGWGDTRKRLFVTLDGESRARITNSRNVTVPSGVSRLTFVTTVKSTSKKTLYIE
jgi:hypothetical protein